MKKLIISIVATASLALVAKAEVLNSTSFEELDVGAITADNKGAFLDENGYFYWTGYSTDSYLEVKELGTAGGLNAKPENVARPMTGADSKALAIDVDTPLSRNIATVEGAGVPQAIGDGLYFDSMVQFTATDTLPTVTDGDKLIVWLKEPPEEEGSTYKLCVTAGVWNEGGSATATVYENTNPEITVSKDEWCRLTISVSKNAAGYPVFRVFVNGKLFTSDEVSEFNSLAGVNPEDANQITSVSFQGKGAIDDLVWTTDDPLYVAPETTDVSLAFNNPADIGEVYWSYGENDITVENNASILKDLEIGSKVVFCCEAPVNYTVTGSNGIVFTPAAVEEGEDYVMWTSSEVEVTENLALTFTITKDDVPAANFTVGYKTFATFAEAIAEVAQNGGTIVIAQDAADESLVLAETVVIAADTTINFNGKTLTSTAGTAIKVTAGILTLTGEGGITAPWVVIQQGTKNGGETTTVNVDADVNLLSRNELEKTGNNGYGDNVVYLCGKATLNVAGTLETDSDYYCAIQTSGADELADVAITIEGTVINNNEVAIGLNLHKNATGSLIVADGASITGKSGIYAKSGSVTINGGTITATGKLGEASNEPGGTATGNALVVDKKSGYANLTVAVTGGTFNGYNGEAAIASVGEEIVGFVTGGMFNTEIAEALLGTRDGKELELVEAEKDGYWTVAEKKVDETPKFGDEAYDPEDVDQNGEWTAVNSSSVITVPTGWELDDKANTITKGAVVIKIPGYYSITPAQGGGYSLALNETARPTVAAEGATKPMEFVTEGGVEVVKLNVPNIKSRLYYSVVYADDVKFTKNMVKTNPVQGAVPSAPKGTNGRFFKVVVTDVPAQN